MNPIQSVKAPVSKIHLVCLVVLVALYAWGFLYSALLLDSSRDLTKAYQIIEYHDWPALGPDVGGFFHLGPLWFYLLAIPASFGSLKFVALFVGALAGLKFVMAYQLGKDLVNAQFGLLWAFALLLPGWHTINQAFINHVNVLEFLSLWFVWLLFRFELTHDSKYFLWSTLAFGLGLNAHPVFLVLFVGYFWVFFRLKKLPDWKQIGIGLLLVSLPFFPYLLNQIIYDFPDYYRFLDRSIATDQIRASGHAIEASHWVFRWISLIKSILYDGPMRVVDFVSHSYPLVGSAYLLFYCLMVILAMVGLIFSVAIKKEKSTVYLIALLVVAIGLIMMLRSFTPFYFSLCISALLLGLFSYGLFVILQNRLTLYKVVIVSFLAVGLLPTLSLRDQGINQQINFGPIMNITTKVEGNWTEKNPTLDALIVKQSKHVADYFCNKSTVINGPLAPLIDISGSLPMNFYCDKHELILGGPSQTGFDSVLVLSKYFFDKVDAKPSFWLSDTWGALLEYENHQPFSGLTPGVFDDYVHPPRSNHKLQEIQTRVFDINVEDTRYLFISNLLPFNVQYKVEKILANGKTPELKVVNAANHLYYCGDCQSGRINWQLTLISNDFNAIDVNTF